MQVFNQFGKLTQLRQKKAVLTIGTFDGLHLGHQKIIRKVVDRSKRLGATSVVLTYAQHPYEILFPRSQSIPPLITNLDQKMALLREWGVQCVVLIPFSISFSKISPENFIRNQVCRYLNVAEFYVGKDATFGKGGEGNARSLQRYGRKYGFKVFLVSKVKVGKRVISSTFIRTLIQKGKMHQIPPFLGRAYSVSGEVVAGSGIGKKLGFPTANIKTENCFIPPNGVYAVLIKWSKRTYPAVLNIGFRPTIEALRKAKPIIEAHLLDFNKNLYKKIIEIQFIHKLRNEKKFQGLSQLQAQIKRDIAKSREKFF